MHETPDTRGVLSFLSGIETWKKTFIVIVLVFFLGTCWTLYQQRRELTFLALSYFGAPRIDESAIDGEARALMVDTGAASLSIWSVNIPRNQRTSLYVRIGGQRMPDLEGISDVALRPYSEHSRQIIRLLSDNTICYDVQQVTPVGHAAADAGVRYVCSVRIPQKAGVFIGIVAAGFTRKPNNEDYIRIRLMTASERLIH
jgi:hypothetical protein